MRDTGDEIVLTAFVNAISTWSRRQFNLHPRASYESDFS